VLARFGDIRAELHQVGLKPAMDSHEGYRDTRSYSWSRRDRMHGECLRD
jgi:hypothetical protein